MIGERMEGNVLLVIKANSKVNYLQKEKKEKRESDGSFDTLLNGFMSNREEAIGKRQVAIGKKGVDSSRISDITVTRAEEKQFFEDLKELKPLRLKMLKWRREKKAKEKKR